MDNTQKYQGDEQGILADKNQGLNMYELEYLEDLEKLEELGEYLKVRPTESDLGFELVIDASGKTGKAREFGLKVSGWTETRYETSSGQMIIDLLPDDSVQTTVGIRDLSNPGHFQDTQLIATENGSLNVRACVNPISDGAGCELDPPEIALDQGGPWISSSPDNNLSTSSGYGLVVAGDLKTVLVRKKSLEEPVVLTRQGEASKELSMKVSIPRKSDTKGWTFRFESEAGIGAEPEVKIASAPVYNMQNSKPRPSFGPVETYGSVKVYEHKSNDFKAIPKPQGPPVFEKNEAGFPNRNTPVPTQILTEADHIADEVAKIKTQTILVIDLALEILDALNQSHKAFVDISEDRKKNILSQLGSLQQQLAGMNLKDDQDFVKQYSLAFDRFLDAILDTQKSMMDEISSRKSSNNQMIGHLEMEANGEVPEQFNDAIEGVKVELIKKRNRIQGYLKSRHIIPKGKDKEDSENLIMQSYLEMVKQFQGVIQNLRPSRPTDMQYLKARVPTISYSRMNPLYFNVQTYGKFRKNVDILQRIFLDEEIIGEQGPLAIELFEEVLTAINENPASHPYIQATLDLIPKVKEFEKILTKNNIEIPNIPVEIQTNVNAKNQKSAESGVKIRPSIESRLHAKEDDHEYVIHKDIISRSISGNNSLKSLHEDPLKTKTRKKTEAKKSKERQSRRSVPEFQNARHKVNPNVDNNSQKQSQGSQKKQRTLLDSSMNRSFIDSFKDFMHIPKPSRDLEEQSRSSQPSDLALKTDHVPISRIPPGGKDKKGAKKSSEKHLNKHKGNTMAEAEEHRKKAALEASRRKTVNYRAFFSF